MMSTKKKDEKYRKAEKKKDLKAEKKKEEQKKKDLKAEKKKKEEQKKKDLKAVKKAEKKKAAEAEKKAAEKAAEKYLKAEKKKDLKAEKKAATKAAEAAKDSGDLVVVLGLVGEEIRLSAASLRQVAARARRGPPIEDFCFALKACIWRAACEAVPGFGCWIRGDSKTKMERILATWMKLVRSPDPCRNQGDATDPWETVVAVGDAPGETSVSELSSHHLHAILLPPIDAYGVAVREWQTSRIIGSTFLVRVLVARAPGAAINYAPCAPEWLEAPLVYAIRHGNIDLVRLLVENRADVNQYDAATGVTPLRVALSRPYSERHHPLGVFQLLRENGAEIRNQAALGYSANPTPANIPSA